MKQMEWHKGQLRALKGVFNEIDARLNRVEFIRIPIGICWGFFDCHLVGFHGDVSVPQMRTTIDQRR